MQTNLDKTKSVKNVRSLLCHATSSENHKIKQTSYSRCAEEFFSISLSKIKK